MPPFHWVAVLEGQYFHDKIKCIQGSVDLVYLSELGFEVAYCYSILCH